MKNTKGKEEKKYFLQIRVTESEKKTLEAFVKHKGTTMSKFIRSCYRFFMNRDMTSEEFITQVAETEGEMPSELWNRFAQRIDKSDLKIATDINNMRMEMRKGFTNMSKEFVDYMSTVVDTLRDGEFDG